jgi:hypothetical protein
MQDPKPVMIDQDGTKWWNWLYEYDWDGETYVFSICAPTLEDANARLKRLPLARVLGQQHGCGIPFAYGGFLVPAIAAVRNVMARVRHCLISTP